MNLRAWLAEPWYYSIEALLAVALLALAAAFPRLGHRHFARLENAASRLARRPVLSLAAVCFGLIAVRLAMLPLFPIPIPAVHDEFSLLLGGDTLSRGRLTNPTHPLWRHF